MKKVIITILVIGVIAAVGYAAMNRSGGGVTLGKDIPAGVQEMTVAQATERAQKHEGMEVVLTGTMEEKCPTSGCWFYLSDDTGRIRVDAQFSGFNVVDRKVGSKVTVYGKLLRISDGDAEVSALGAKF